TGSRSTGSTPWCAEPLSLPKTSSTASGSTDRLHLFERQAGHEVLRLHAQHLILRGGHDEIDRIARACGTGQFQAIERGDAASGRIIDRLANPEQVADFCAFGIEPDIPGELRILHFR